MVMESSTPKTRVIDMLHSRAILIDSQEKIAYQDRMTVSQALDPRKSITRFHIINFVAPSGCIHLHIYIPQV